MHPDDVPLISSFPPITAGPSEGAGGPNAAQIESFLEQLLAVSSLIEDGEALPIPFIPIITVVTTVIRGRSHGRPHGSGRDR